MTRLIGYRCKCSNVFSRVVLIGREAYPFKFINTVRFLSYRLTLSLFFLSLNFGGYSLGVTPLPIPNREVKPQNADGTACAGVWESRSLPGFILIPIFDRDFFCCYGLPILKMKFVYLKIIFNLLLLFV